MSMRDLENPEMIQLSTPVLKDGTRQHEVLVSVPSGVAALPVMQAAHDELVAVESRVDLGLLSSEVHGLVDRHDALVVGIASRLDAEITVADAVDAPKLQHARDEIFPPGESLLRSSAAAKAGEGHVRAHRVSPETIALLATIPLRGGGTLGDKYGELQDVTQQLSDVDGEYKGALAEQSGPRVREARKRWVAAVELIDVNLRASGVDPTPVLGAIRAAQARSRSSDASPATPSTPTTPSPTPETTPTPATTPTPETTPTPAH